MPYTMRKVNGYEVASPHGIKAKRTTKRKGQSQLNLLRGVKHGWVPTSKLARYKRIARPGK